MIPCCLHPVASTLRGRSTWRNAAPMTLVRSILAEHRPQWPWLTVGLRPCSSTPPACRLGEPRQAAQRCPCSSFCAQWWTGGRLGWGPCLQTRRPPRPCCRCCQSGWSGYAPRCHTPTQKHWQPQRRRQQFKQRGGRQGHAHSPPPHPRAREGVGQGPLPHPPACWSCPPPRPRSALARPALPAAQPNTPLRPQLTSLLAGSPPTTRPWRPLLGTLRTPPSKASTMAGGMGVAAPHTVHSGTLPPPRTQTRGPAAGT